MKTAHKVLVLAIGTALNFSVPLFAQQSDFEVMLQAVEATTPFPASNSPPFGTFYTIQHAQNWPPLPANTVQVPFWSLGGGFYLLDDRTVDWDQLKAEAEAEALLSAGLDSNFSMMSSSMLNSSYAYGNPVYLTNLVASSTGAQPVSASVSIAGGTNNVPWDILMSTNVAKSLSTWSWLGIGYTANRYTFSNQPLDQAIYILAKPQKTMVVGWGNDDFGQCDVPMGITNALMVAGRWLPKPCAADRRNGGCLGT